MPSFEQDRQETASATPVEDRPARAGDVEAEVQLLIMDPESPTGAAARMLELAGITADRLVTDAQTEAESLVTVAQARADAILEAAHNEANEIAAELARTKEESRPPN